MFPSFISTWLAQRRHLRALWKQDARQLIERDERNAYYAAQRLAARCWATGDAKGFMHWAKVSAEVARISSIAEMELSMVEDIVAEEMGRGTTK